MYLLGYGALISWAGVLLALLIIARLVKDWKWGLKFSHQIPSGTWCFVFQSEFTYIWGRVLPSTSCISGRPFTLKMEIEVPSAMLVSFYTAILHNNAENANLCFLPCLQHPTQNWYQWTVSKQSKWSRHIYLVSQTHFVICYSIKVQFLSLLIPLLHDREKCVLIFTQAFMLHCSWVTVKYQ
jgi:hypothetical protein